MKRRLALMIAGAALAHGCASAPAPAPSPSQDYADFAIGRLADLRADHEVAADRFMNAARKSPRDAALAQGAVRAALASGDLGGARAAARMARDLPAPAARLVRAADALNAGQWRSARALLDGADGGIDEVYAARIIAAWAEIGLGQTDEAVAELRRLTAPRPFASVFIFQQAMALDLAGRGGEALTLYERAGQDTTWLAPAIVRHADLLARLDRRDDADAVLAQAMDRRTSPELADARARLADGETPARRRLTAAEAAGIGLYGLGALAGQDSDGDAGLVILSLALTAAPKLDAALIAFADAQRAQSRGEAARAALAEIDPASPYAESARLMSAWILRDQGHEDAAIAAASAGASRQARTAHADLLRSFSRYGEAEPIYTGLIEENGEDWRLLFARGAVRERLKRWPEAEADLQRALALSPENPDVMNYLGYTWVDRGERRDEAMAMIARAAELRPNSGAIMDSLGWAHFRLGAYDLALGYLERAVELEPSDPILNDHLGDAYWRVGRRLEARFQWRRVLTLEPEAEQRAAVEAKVADGLPLRPLAENAR